jgi:hypothetical protein
MTEVPPDPEEARTLPKQGEAGERRAFDRLFARFRCDLISVAAEVITRTRNRWWCGCPGAGRTGITPQVSGSDMELAKKRGAGPTRGKSDPVGATSNAPARSRHTRPNDDRQVDCPAEPCAGAAVGPGSRCRKRKPDSIELVCRILNILQMRSTRYRPDHAF